jgi:hypothetical protein
MAVRRHPPVVSLHSVVSVDGRLWSSFWLAGSVLHMIDEPLTSKSHYGSGENEEQLAEIGDGNCDRDQ